MQIRRVETPSDVGAMALREAGGAVAALADGVFGLDFASGVFAPIAGRAEAAPGAAFNDGKVDRRGRFVIGLSDSNLKAPRPIGGICSLGADHNLRVLERGVNFANSACWSPETGHVANRRRFVDTTELGGGADGATVSSGWRFRGAKIVAFRPDGRASGWWRCRCGSPPAPVSKGRTSISSTSRP